MKPCKACKQAHYGFCDEKSVPLSTRIRAGKWVDGDRVPDYLDTVLDGSSQKILAEIEALEQRIKELEGEKQMNARP